MGPDDQRLFYVSGFGGAGDENAKAIWAPMNSFVSLVKIVHDLLRWNDQDQMLRDDKDGPVGSEGFAGDPDRGIFGHSEFAWNDGHVNAFEVVRIFDRA